MPTFSQYVSDDDIKAAKDNIVEVEKQLVELDLADKAGIETGDLRQSLLDAKQRLITFIQVYEKLEQVKSNRRTK